LPQRKSFLCCSLFTTLLSISLSINLALLNMSLSSHLYSYSSCFLYIRNLCFDSLYSHLCSRFLSLTLYILFHPDTFFIVSSVSLHLHLSVLIPFHSLHFISVSKFPVIFSRCVSLNFSADIVEKLDKYSYLHWYFNCLKQTWWSRFVEAVRPSA
jgi:hypothetical protein